VASIDESVFEQFQAMGSSSTIRYAFSETLHFCLASGARVQRRKPLANSRGSADFRFE